MRLGRRKREEAEVESSSLSDIMFFLMLFFLIASTLANPNVIKIMLPQAKTTSTVQKKPFILTVKFDENDETKTKVLYFIDSEKKPVSLDALTELLKTKNKEFFDAANPDNRLNVVLRLDKALTIQQMVDVMEIGANLGIRMVLATDKTRQ